MKAQSGMSKKFCLLNSGADLGRLPYEKFNRTAGHEWRKIDSCRIENSTLITIKNGGHAADWLSGSDSSRREDPEDIHLY